MCTPIPWILKRKQKHICIVQVRFFWENIYDTIYSSQHLKVCYLSINIVYKICFKFCYVCPVFFKMPYMTWIFDLLKVFKCPQPKIIAIVEEFKCSLTILLRDIGIIWILRYLVLMPYLKKVLGTFRYSKLRPWAF